MKLSSKQYWDASARKSASSARNAVLYGFTSEAEFDEAVREDASCLVAPFIGPRDVVLEIGAGVGRITKWIAPRCRSVIGLDISEEMLKRARSRLTGQPNVSFRRMPMSLKLPIPSRAIDFALFYHVTEHLEREDTYTLLQEVRRVLKPRGQAIVGVSLLSHEDNQAEFRKWTGSPDLESVRSRFYSESEAETLLDMARLHPQLRLYVPGEYVVLVTPRSQSLLGAMPFVRWGGLARTALERRNPI